jgi:molecular chaperone GrpE
METENGITIEQGQLEECRQEVQRWKDLYARLNADIENIKRRAHKDQEFSVNRSLMQVFGGLLPIIDNFDRALAASGAELHTTSLYQGLLLIRKEFAAVLERYGVREMTETAQFDPELHEALSQVPADAHTTSGTIVTVLEKGYWYKDQVLRHAKVTVTE